MLHQLSCCLLRVKNMEKLFKTNLLFQVLLLMLIGNNEFTLLNCDKVCGCFQTETILTLVMPGVWDV